MLLKYVIIIWYIYTVKVLAIQLAAYRRAG